MMMWLKYDKNTLIGVFPTHAHFGNHTHVHTNYYFTNDNDDGIHDNIMHSKFTVSVTDLCTIKPNYD